MGGKNAVIILADADLERAGESVAVGALGATGQRCTATSRAVVAKPLLADFIALLGSKADSFMPGDGMTDGVRMGPLVDASQLQKVRAKIADGKREGAKLVRDGSDAGIDGRYFVAPTILTHVDPRMSDASDQDVEPVPDEN